MLPWWTESGNVRFLCGRQSRPVSSSPTTSCGQNEPRGPRPRADSSLQNRFMHAEAKQIIKGLAERTGHVPSLSLPDVGQTLAAWPALTLRFWPRQESLPMSMATPAACHAGRIRFLLSGPKRHRAEAAQRRGGWHDSVAAECQFYPYYVTFSIGNPASRDNY